jgi:sugar phosphate permease
VGFGVLGDVLIKRARWPVRSVRVFVAVFAEVVPALCLAAAGFSTSAPVIIALLTASVGFSGAGSASYASSYMDLAPADAGTLLAIGNTLATFAGIIAPIAVGEMVAAPNDDALHWRGVFLMAAGIAGVGFVLYVTFISAEPLSCFSSPKASEDPEAEGDEAETAGLVLPVRR